MSTTPDLGAIVTSTSARKAIYATYGICAFIVGGTAAYFLGIGAALPEILVGAQAVVAYTGIAVGGLALANTSNGSGPDHRA
ncbi:hypothetical protein EDF22_0662 [Rathayibacter sp. PhB127]|jgi:Ca2+/Na+ antiporter|uniref:hypothetical protein n=1 Tax=Rathayibacter sp. PhB127 TaxID=2485176 RepID=UPI000FBA72BC|nr:hypothetical protein [Rathayibacter sp. PhB127]ROS28930.1 hypothetical protein EDF22_0662 [Rathayibacter sp. PhB127]